MTVIPIKLPSEVERLRQDVAATVDWTSEQRLHGVLGLLDAISRFATATNQQSGDRFHDHEKDEWQRGMRDFIQQQLQAQSRREFGGEAARVV